MSSTLSFNIIFYNIHDDLCNPINLLSLFPACVIDSLFAASSIVLSSSHPLLPFHFLRYQRTLHLHYTPNHTNFTLILSSARSLCQCTFPTQTLAIVPFWCRAIEAWLEEKTPYLTDQTKDWGYQLWKTKPILSLRNRRKILNFSAANNVVEVPDHFT